MEYVVVIYEHKDGTFAIQAGKRDEAVYKNFGNYISVEIVSGFKNNEEAVKWKKLWQAGNPTPEQYEWMRQFPSCEYYHADKVTEISKELEKPATVEKPVFSPKKWDKDGHNIEFKEYVLKMAGKKKKEIVDAAIEHFKVKEVLEKMGHPNHLPQIKEIYAFEIDSLFRQYNFEAWCKL